MPWRPRLSRVDSELDRAPVSIDLRFSPHRLSIGLACQRYRATVAIATRSAASRRDDGSEEPERLAPRARLETPLRPPLRNIDHVHRAVALAADEELVAAKRHVHGLAADLDGGLRAERRVDQAHRVALEAGNADQAVVRAVARDLRGLPHALDVQCAIDTLCSK